MRICKQNFYKQNLRREFAQIPRLKRRNEKVGASSLRSGPTRGALSHAGHEKTGTRVSQRAGVACIGSRDLI